MNNTKRTIGRSLPAPKLVSAASQPKSVIGSSSINNASKAPGSKIGMNQLGNQNKAAAPVPQINAGEGQNRTKIYTFFTKAGATETLYSGDRLWANVKIELETAGPVAIGDAESLTPVLSGKGQLLPTGREVSKIISKGSRIYIASTSVNRVKVTIEPVPWLEQMSALLGMIAAGTEK